MVMALAHGLSAPVFGWLSDKIGGPVLMLIGLSSLSIALVLLRLSMAFDSCEINTVRRLWSHHPTACG